MICEWHSLSERILRTTQKHNTSILMCCHDVFVVSPSFNILLSTNYDHFIILSGLRPDWANSCIFFKAQIVRKQMDPKVVAPKANSGSIVTMNALTSIYDYSTERKNEKLELILSITSFKKIFVLCCVDVFFAMTTQHKRKSLCSFIVIEWHGLNRTKEKLEANTKIFCWIQFSGNEYNFR